MGPGSSGGGVYSLTKDLDASSLLAQALCPGELTFTICPYSIAVTDEDIYWSEELLIRGMRLAEGQARSISMDPGVWPEVPWLVVHGGHVYWVAEDRVMRAARQGGQAELLADHQSEVWRVAVDDSGVYWTTRSRSENGRGNVMRLWK